MTTGTGPRKHRRRQGSLSLAVPVKVIIEPLVDEPALRHFRVYAEMDTDTGRDFEFLNPIISWLPPGMPEKRENVITEEYFFITLKAAVLAAAMRWPEVPIELDRYRHRTPLRLRPSVTDNSE